VVVGEGAKLEIATLAFYMWLTQANRYRRFIVSLLPHSVGRLDFFLRFKFLRSSNGNTRYAASHLNKTCDTHYSEPDSTKILFFGAFGAFGESGRRDESTFDLMAGGLSR
jgi:hypothetical protein